MTEIHTYSRLQKKEIIFIITILLIFFFFPINQSSLFWNPVDSVEAFTDCFRHKAHHDHHPINHIQQPFIHQCINLFLLSLTRILSVILSALVVDRRHSNVYSNANRVVIHSLLSTLEGSAFHQRGYVSNI